MVKKRETENLTRRHGVPFCNQGADAVTQAVDLAPQFQWIRGAEPLKSRAGSKAVYRVRTQFSKNSSALGEEKPGLKGRISYVSLIIHFIAWML